MDLSTTYLGLNIRNPLVPSASPLTRSLDSARRLQDHGAGALIMYSLFEEEVSAESESMVRFLHQQGIGNAEATEGFLPDYEDFENKLDLYLEQVRTLKEHLEIPVIASLNGITPGGWLKHAHQIEEAGADALELNVYYISGDIGQSGEEVENRYLTLLRELRAAISIPINMKLSPAFSSVGHFTTRLAAEGASGVALFNRFYQPDIDVDNLRLRARLYPSSSAETLLAMRWIAILYGRIDGFSLGATGGVHTVEDAIKLLLAGADVVHLCHVLLERGPAFMEIILKGIEQWMDDHGFESVADFRGRVSALAVPHPDAFERANYVNVIDNFSSASGVMI